VKNNNILDPEQQSGTLTYWAIGNNEPSGRPLPECSRIKIDLTLIAPGDDLIGRKQGLAALRQHRIKRLTHEASAAGTVLTYEDLADILTSSVSTVFRDINELRRQGEFIPTRGQVKDIGRNINNKLQMAQLFCGQVASEEIARRFHRTVAEVEKQLELFQRAVSLFNRRMPLANIAKLTGLSPSLVREYIQLAEQYKLLEKTSGESNCSERVNDG
jgi:Fic family protein